MNELDGIVIIDIDYNFLSCWNKSSEEYWLFHSLTEVCEIRGTPVFWNGSLYHQEGQTAQWRDELSSNWKKIDKDIGFNFPKTYGEIGDLIEQTLEKPRSETDLGFGGTVSVNCVRHALHSFCENTEPSLEEEWSCRRKLVEIGEKFARGKLLYEFTDSLVKSFLHVEPTASYLTEKAKPHRRYYHGRRMR